MKAVVQRVLAASVSVAGKRVGTIDRGLCVFVSIEQQDTDAEVHWLVRKLQTLRLFSDESGRMNLSLSEVDGGLLLISNFTVAGRVSKGTRPDYSHSANAEDARILFDGLIDAACAAGIRVATGKFGADMTVDVHNDGPVTLILEKGAAA